MARKILLIVASLTLIVAGGALFMSMTATASAPTATTVTVYIASGDLAPGTAGGTLGPQQVQAVNVANNAVPPGALADLAVVKTLKTVVPVFKGQILMSRQFAESSATGGLPIPAGKNAVSVELSDPARVAGFVQPGSKVVVYAQVDSKSTVLLPSASVIAVGPATQLGAPPADSATAPNKGVATTIVTLALTTDESNKLIGALGVTLYLGLLPN